jgi:hypothetical protein
MMRSRRQRRAREVALRDAATAYAQAQRRVQQAHTGLRDAQQRHRPAPELAERYRDLTRALTDQLTAARRGHRVAAEPPSRRRAEPRRAWVQQQLAAARREARAWQHRVVAASAARQRHLLDADAASGVRQPSVVPTDGSIDLGPFWPETDYLPGPPQRWRPVPARVAG